MKVTRHIGIGITVAATLAMARIEGQAVQGRVISGSDPVPGALLEVLRVADSVVIGSASSGADGGFRIASTFQGPRILRVRGIGFRPWIGRVPDAADALIIVGLTRAPFELADLRASAERRSCGRRVVDQTLMTAVAELVQTTDAIIARNLARQDLRFESEHQRVEVITVGRTDSTASATTRVISGWPIVAPSIAVLEEEGFGREKRGAEGNGRWFYGLDLNVFWSEWFLSQHCFWFEDGGKVAKDSTVSLHFRPIARSKQVDVEGELVIDATSWTIRRLIFYHVNLPSWFPSHSSGGMLEFASTPDGVWYPSTWLTHSPIERARGNLSRPVLGAVLQPRPTAPELVGYIEERGRVIGVRTTSEGGR